MNLATEIEAFKKVHVNDASTENSAVFEGVINNPPVKSSTLQKKQKL